MDEPDERASPLRPSKTPSWVLLGFVLGALVVWMMPRENSRSSAPIKAPVDSLLIPHNIIRNLVATIVSLDGDPVAMRLRPVAHVAGLPAVDGEAGSLTLSPQNYARYTPYVDALNKISGKQIAAVYLHYYPLFQAAYEELGYKGHYFNDRLVKIIDHLRATPKVEAPIKLVRPKVLYEFEDTALEERSWGQKILIRMGPENAAVVKAKLGEIRAAVIASESKG